MNFTVSHNFHLQYLPANLHTSWNSCTSNGKVGKMARWQQKQIRDILLCLHQPNPQLGHHPALERFGILIFFSAAREAVGVFDDAFVWSGNDLRVNLSEIFHQAEMLRPSVWSVIWGDYHSPSLFGAESKCHAQYQTALTLYRYISWLMVQQTRTDFEIQASVGFFLITSSTRLHVVHNEHSACLWRHLRNKAWPDQIYIITSEKWLDLGICYSTPMHCPIIASRTAAGPATLLWCFRSFFSFFCFFSFCSRTWRWRAHGVKAKRIPKKQHSSATLKWWNMWLVQLHSDKEHGMPTILMSCDAKDVSPKTLMKLYETTQMSRRLCSPCLRWKDLWPNAPRCFWDRGIFDLHLQWNQWRKRHRATKQLKRSNLL